MQLMTFKQFINEDSDLDTKLKKFGLKRGGSGYKIGKVIGGEVYCHKNYESQFPNDELELAKSKLPNKFHYDTLKYNPKTKSFTFFRVDDFDSNPEPIIDEYVTIGANTELGVIKKGGQIYHHKWQWVGDDYKGFDVIKNKERSAKWSVLTDDDIGQEKYKTKIGSNAFWQKHVVEPHLKESNMKTVTLPRDTVGEHYQGSKETVPKGTKIKIEDYTIQKDGSIQIFGFLQDLIFKFQYDSKTEAENDLGVDL